MFSIQSLSSFILRSFSRSENPTDDSGNLELFPIKRMQKHQEGKICGFCGTGEETVSSCGRLFWRPDVCAHRRCMQYSAKLAQYERTTFGGFDVKEVKSEVRRGNQLKCNLCKAGKGSCGTTNGATAGCAWPACSKTFHFLCARQAAVTRRIHVTDPRGRQNFMYRVFCGEDHLKNFSNKFLSKSVVSYTEDSDENWEPESDPESEIEFKVPVPRTDAAHTGSETSSSTSQEPERPAVKKKKKLRPTWRAPEPSFFEMDSSDEGSDFSYRLTGRARPASGKKSPKVKVEAAGEKKRTLVQPTITESLRVKAKGHGDAKDKKTPQKETKSLQKDKQSQKSPTTESKDTGKDAKDKKSAEKGKKSSPKVESAQKKSPRTSPRENSIAADNTKSSRRNLFADDEGKKSSPRSPRSSPKQKQVEGVTKGRPRVTVVHAVSPGMFDKKNKLAKSRNTQERTSDEENETRNGVKTPDKASSKDWHRATPHVGTKRRTPGRPKTRPLTDGESPSKKLRTEGAAAPKSPATRLRCSVSDTSTPSKNLRARDVNIRPPSSPARNGDSSPTKSDENKKTKSPQSSQSAPAMTVAAVKSAETNATKASSGDAVPRERQKRHRGGSMDGVTSDGGAANGAVNGKTKTRTSRKRLHSESDSAATSDSSLVSDTSSDERTTAARKLGDDLPLPPPTNCEGDAFVVCVLEDAAAAPGKGAGNALTLTRLIQQQFVVAEHRMTRWKYGGVETPSRAQMLCFMRDITRALLNGDGSELYRLLFDLGPDDLQRYEHLLDFNVGLVGGRAGLEHKLRNNVVTNLTVAQEQEKSGRRHGCVLATSDDAVTLVLLVGERLDPNYRIRSKLGHSFSAHPWSEHTVAKDVSQFGAEVAQYFASLELQNLSELLEHRMKDAVFDVFVKPSDALLQLKNTNRITERLRYFLKLKRQKLNGVKNDGVSNSANVLFIGPLDTACVDTRAFCQKCIPLFVEENLTALRDVFVVVDRAVGCNVHTLDDLFREERLPPGTEARVWSAFNPAVLPVTSVLLQFKYRQM